MGKREGEKGRGRGEGKREGEKEKEGGKGSRKKENVHMNNLPSLVKQPWS